MSKDTNMTVFVMAVEIERLNGEVDAWKLRYTDLDRRISDRASVEDSLRIESQKVLEFRNQVTLLSNENAGLRAQIKGLIDEKEQWRIKFSQVDVSLQSKYEDSERRVKDLFREIESWKMRYSTLEKTKDKEMEDLRLTFEARRKSYIEREVKDITVRFNMEKSNWENDMRRLRDLLDARTKENEDLKIRYGKLEVNLGEFKGSQAKIIEYENRLALMSSEIERLNAILKKKSDEIEDWRNRYSKLEITFNQSSGKDAKIRELESIISGMQREIERIQGILREKDNEVDKEKIKRSKLESDVGGIKVLEMKLKEYENKLALLTSEIERLNMVLLREKEEKDRMKNRIGELESNNSSFQLQIKQWESRYKDSMNEIDEWKKRFGDFQLNFNEYRSYEVKVREYENKLALMASELQRLNDMLAKGKNENEQLRNRIKEFEVIELKIREYENKINLLTSEIDRLNSVLKTRGDELSDWKTKYSKLEISINEYRGLENKLREYESTVAGMQREIERLNGLIRERHDDLEKEKVKRSKLENDISTIKVLEMRIQEYENKLALITSELERLNSLLMKERDEKEKLKKKVLEYESEIGKFKLLIQDWELRYNRQAKDLEEWKRRHGELSISINEYRGYEGRLKEYENKIAMISSENERLSSMIKNYREEINGLRVKLNEYEIIMKDIPGLQGQVKQWESRYNLVLKELDDWKKKHGDLIIQIAEFNELKKKIGDFEKLAFLLYTEIDRLNSILVKEREEKEMIKRKCFDFEHNLQEIPQLQMTIKQWEVRFGDIVKELEEWKKRHGDIQLKITEYRTLEVKMRDLENKIVFLSTENERLNNVLKTKGDEIEGWKKKYSTLEIQLAEARSLEIKIREYENNMNMMQRELERLNGILKDKHDDLEKEKVKRSKLEGDLSTIKVLEMRIQEYENKLAMLSSELDRLNHVLGKEREEKEKMKLRIYELDNENGNMKGLIQQWESRYSSVQKEIEIWKKKFIDIEASHNQMRGYEGQLKEYENRIALLSSEIERLNSLLRNRGEDIESWKNKYMKLEISFSEAKQMEIKIREYEGIINTLQREIERLNSFLRDKHDDLEKEKVKRSKLENDVNVIKVLEAKIQDYENKIVLLSSEIERLNSLFAKERDEKEKFKLKIYEYEQQLNNMGGLQRELEGWRKRYSDLEITITEYRGYESKVREYENKLALLSSELDRLRTMNMQKTEEVETWKTKYYKIESSMGQLKEYEMKIQILAQEIDRLNDVHNKDLEEITIYKNKWVEYSSLNNRINEHLALFVVLMAENEALRARVIEKENEVEEVRRQSLTPFRKSVSEIHQENVKRSGNTITYVHTQQVVSGAGGDTRKSGTYGQMEEESRKSGAYGQVGEEIRKSGTYLQPGQVGGQGQFGQNTLFVQSQRLTNSGNWSGQIGGGQSVQYVQSSKQFSPGQDSPMRQVSGQQSYQMSPGGTTSVTRVYESQSGSKSYK